MEFGKAAKGKVVHLMVASTDKLFNVARCDKKIAIQSVKGSITVVSCAKCKKYADYKQALEEQPERKAEIAATNPYLFRKTEKKKAPAPKKKAPAKKSAPKKKAPAKKSAPKKKPIVSDEPKAETAEEKLAKIKAENKRLRQEKVELKSTLKSKDNELREARLPAGTLPEKKEDKRPVTEENYKEFMKGKKPEESKISEKHFKSEKEPSGKYRVVHLPSGKSSMNGVEEKVIETVLKYLNNIKVKWNSATDPVPKNFLPACAAAIRAAYRNHGIKIKIGVEGARAIKRRQKPEQPKARKIKRRAKAVEKPEKSERVIKRRGQKSTNEFGYRQNTQKATVSEMLKIGSRFGEIKEELNRIDSTISDKQVRGKIAAVMRKLIKNGHTIVVVHTEDRNENVYHIAEDIDE